MSAVRGASTLSFLERYDEMRDLGIPDWQIAKKMGISCKALERQLWRYGRPISALLGDMTRDEEERTRRRCG